MPSGRTIIHLGIKRHVFYGWWVALASAGIVFVTGGISYYSLSAYFDSIVTEFGWKRADIAGAYSVRSLESGIVSPLLGFTFDRFGPRLLFLSGVVLCSLGLVMLGMVNSMFMLYASFAVISLGGSACGHTTSVSSVARWFVRKRGRALGLATAGGGAGGVLVLLSAWLIVSLGWRQALFISAAGVFAICLPLCFAVRHKPEDHGLLPDGERQKPPTPKALTASSGETDFSPRQAMRTPAFWLLGSAVGLVHLATNAVIVHQIPFLTSIGLSTQAAATVMTLTVVASLGGRLMFGWFADSRDPRTLLAISFFLTAAGLFVLAYTRTTWHIVFFIVTFGTGYAARTALMAALQGQYFGVKSFGTIQGLLHSFTVVLGIAGPVMTGWLYDVRGNYWLAFMLMGTVALLSIPLALASSRPRPIPREVPGP
ncbi:MAG: MFS transporter [Chloroflexi bacterium]|nr:MFS transporter [Chloroflexota bacterium]